MGTLPSNSPDTCAVVQNIVGGKRNPYPDLTDYLQTRVRVYVRSYNFVTAHDIADTISNTLNGVYGVELPVITSGDPTLIADMQCDAPFYIGEDDGGHHAFSVNSEMMIRQNKIP
jgi:hypothetical protein